MCPNCILNQAAMQGGMYVAFGICGLFFVVGIVGILWAFKNGDFEDIESTKFDMMDDGEEGPNSVRARLAVEKARLKNLSSVKEVTNG
ncbi:MAG: cbb3-type cytochrome oxidase assembly protein CcoS [Candidatus Melainabacteria bacterium]|nr:cbb3-type cytochrome oxidase assembly protein CcoS [Candidatus Melainabacteria bacterium]